MTAREIRQAFKDFFAAKSHTIVASAPMVVKNDPTLMFTNAGMNQFKDIFLGNKQVESPRVANSQKCLRVSGKHNDLEEVGHDTYHHTMFEMLGNWSFGDYFKKEAISWAWEFLVDVMKLDPERLYASVFEGAADDNLERDDEAAEYWEQYLPKARILNGSKKDNFWEMGEVGPCGPCSEIHIDLRDEEERALIPGSELVNADHPLVIEVWNLVFIQFNRLSTGALQLLPAKHVDTGMGFERLCMAVQNKKSNYDTDVFQSIIAEIGRISDIKYGDNKEADIAMRVIADHIRTIAFSITDGQLPSNNKAGYVIRRILRRAVRYGYTFLAKRHPFMYQLVPVLVEVMGDAYPELKAQEELIIKVLREEEDSFLRTLETGIKLLDKIILETVSGNYKVVDGKVAFELYDTYGFPLDLTELILKEKNLVVNRKEFEAHMQKQKDRARNAASMETGDWVVLEEDDQEEFIGYDYKETDLIITRYRKVKSKKNEFFQLVFNITPFYGESGGQVGDKGTITSATETVQIIDTQKELGLIVHIVKALPKDPTATFKAQVDVKGRQSISNNHSATHLLHEALRTVLGSHVEQKGSLVNTDYLRFDFAHFQKVTEEELRTVEMLVNSKIRENVALSEHRDIPVAKAQEMGAMALFGEKYGDLVRAIQFGTSLELCGGTHVKSTGEIGFFKIISESSTSAGIRRIEALTGVKSESFINQQLDTVKELGRTLNSPSDITKSVELVLSENAVLRKKIEEFELLMLKDVKKDLKALIKEADGLNVLATIVNVPSAAAVKDLCFQLKGEFENLVCIIGANVEDKPNLAIMISDNLVKEKGWNAGAMIREAAKEISGGGGGQPFFATAGGKNPDGLQKAIDKALTLLK